MSIRAYKVITKVLGSIPSFNLSHDVAIYDYIIDHGLDGGLSVHMCGYVTLSVDELKEIIDLLELDASTERNIAMDITLAESKGITEIEYNCF